MSDVTRLLSAIDHGDAHASAELLPLVYDELRRLARAHMARERAGHTLDATALVHEAYLRLLGPAGSDLQWNGRAHFFGAAAEAMRRILVENARRKARLRHGGAMDRVDELETCPVRVQAPAEDLLAVHEALDDLARADARAAELVKLHYFLGVSIDDASAMLGISPRSAYRTWSFARAWLYRRLGGGSP
jgi:RNA polymerase sigma factor (TIGR02999 family)